jgi:hypothetical protein
MRKVAIPMCPMACGACSVTRRRRARPDARSISCRRRKRQAVGAAFADSRRKRKPSTTWKMWSSAAMARAHVTLTSGTPILDAAGRTARLSRHRSRHQRAPRQREPHPAPDQPLRRPERMQPGHRALHQRRGAFPAICRDVVRVRRHEDGVDRRARRSQRTSRAGGQFRQRAGLPRWHPDQSPTRPILTAAVRSAPPCARIARYGTRISSTIRLDRTLAREGAGLRLGGRGGLPLHRRRQGGRRLHPVCRRSRSLRRRCAQAARRDGHGHQLRARRLRTRRQHPACRRGVRAGQGRHHDHRRGAAASCASIAPSARSAATAKPRRWASAPACCPRDARTPSSTARCGRDRCQRPLAGRDLEPAQGWPCLSRVAGDQPRARTRTASPAITSAFSATSPGTRRRKPASSAWRISTR